MANFKHKMFLLIAKWIPVAVAAGILINNTLAMLDVKNVMLIGLRMKMQVVIRFGNILGLFNGLL